MAELHIRLQYISKQHTGADNAFLLGIFDRCAAKTHIFSYAKRSELGEGAKMELMPTPRFGLNGACVNFVHLDRVLTYVSSQIFDKINFLKKKTIDEILLFFFFPSNLEEILIEYRAKTKR